MCVYTPQEELNAVNIKALSDLRTEMSMLMTFLLRRMHACYYYTPAHDFRSQLSSRIKALEKQHEYTLAEKTVKHKNEIEVDKFITKLL